MAPGRIQRGLETIRTHVVTRLEAPLRQAWPAAAGELLDYEIGFAPGGLRVRLRQGV